MRSHWLAHWTRVAAAAEAAMQGDDARDIAAVLAASAMVDAITHGRPVPLPTPEFAGRLAHAEALAQQQ